jgi:hypothetical protein
MLAELREEAEDADTERGNYLRNLAMKRKTQKLEKKNFVKIKREL